MTEGVSKFTSYNHQSISYDLSGNPTSYLGNTLTWTMGRQLASFGSNTYTYNEEGIRTSKTVNGEKTTYYLDGTNIIEQRTGDTVLHFHYDSNDEIIGFTYNEADYFYVKNSMDDITGITDINGNLVASYTYDAWGKELSVTGSNVELGNLNPFRYRSYYYDSDIEMYYLQSRYYDPEVGRFINSDDVSFIGVTGSEISYNPFAYCENNPVNGSDSSGNFSVAYLPNTWFTALFRKLVGFTFSDETVIYKLRSKHISFFLSVIASRSLNSAAPFKFLNNGVSASFGGIGVSISGDGRTYSANSSYLLTDFSVFIKVMKKSVAFGMSFTQFLTYKINSRTKMKMNVGYKLWFEVSKFLLVSAGVLSAFAILTTNPHASVFLANIGTKFLTLYKTPKAVASASKALISIFATIGRRYI